MLAPLGVRVDLLVQLQDAGSNVLVQLFTVHAPTVTRSDEASARFAPLSDGNVAVSIEEARSVSPRVLQNETFSGHGDELASAMALDDVDFFAIHVE